MPSACAFCTASRSGPIMDGVRSCSATSSAELPLGSPSGLMTASVGTKKVPRRFISASVSSSTQVPCSMLRTPARTALATPSRACACAATKRPFFAASATAARISSSVSSGRRGSVVDQTRTLARADLDDVRALLDERARRFGDPVGPRNSPPIASPNCGYAMKNARPGFGRMWPGDTSSSGPGTWPRRTRSRVPSAWEYVSPSTRAVVTPDCSARSAAAGDSMCACASISPGSR